MIVHQIFEDRHLFFRDRIIIFDNIDIIAFRNYLREHNINICWLSIEIIILLFYLSIITLFNYLNEHFQNSIYYLTSRQTSHKMRFIAFNKLCLYVITLCYLQYLVLW